MTAPAYTDRYGRALAVGRRVRVQYCVGRYGQTDIVEGVIETLYPDLAGLTLRRADGSLKYVNIERNGFHKFEDFEHGHERWTEIVG